MKTPPIPPNSKHFTADGVWFCLMPGEPICTIDTARWRSVMSSVASREWTNEAKKIKDKFDLFACECCHERSTERISAFLSDRYRPLDNYDLANAVLPVLADAQIRVESCEVTETRMYIKAVSPRTEMEVKKGDVVQAGIVIGNSEVGNGTLNISPMIYRLVCSNGMISADHSMRKYHTGARNDADNGSWELFSDKTRQLSDAAVWNQVRDLVKGALSDVGFAKIVDGLKVAAGRVIDANPVEIVEVVQRNFSLSDEDKGGILKHLTTGADLSLWGVTNAVTRYSQDVADYTKATELEAIGGQILELPATQWEKISA